MVYVFRLSAFLEDEGPDHSLILAAWLHSLLYGHALCHLVC